MGGGIISAAGALMTVPSILLSAPVLFSQTRRQSQDTSGSSRGVGIGMG